MTVATVAMEKRIMLECRGVFDSDDVCGGRLYQQQSRVSAFLLGLSRPTHPWFFFPIHWLVGYGSGNWLM
jgi:hypothetical protein